MCERAPRRASTYTHSSSSITERSLLDIKISASKLYENNIVLCRTMNLMVLCSVQLSVVLMKSYRYSILVKVTIKGSLTCSMAMILLTMRQILLPTG